MITSLGLDTWRPDAVEGLYSTKNQGLCKKFTGPSESSSLNY